MDTTPTRLAMVALAALSAAPTAHAGGLHAGFDALLPAHVRGGMERGWLGRTRPTLRLSPIFAWFEGDFTTAAGRVVDFVLREAPESARTFIRHHRSDLRITYLDYDWTLNVAR